MPATAKPIGRHLASKLEHFGERFPHRAYPGSVYPHDTCLLEFAAAEFPDAHGVYLILGRRTGAPDVVLEIGRSGTLRHNGFGTQTLRRRLSRGKDGTTPRHVLWPALMRELDYTALVVRWFVTVDRANDTCVLPAKAEADLIQAFYDDYRGLPPWNRAY